VAVTEIGEVAFGYDEAGSGPAVLLVHAGLADRQMWEHQFQVLRQRHRVIRYDWRGYGESGDAVGEVARHEDVLALMDALGVDEPVNMRAGRVRPRQDGRGRPAARNRARVQ